MKRRILNIEISEISTADKLINEVVVGFPSGDLNNLNENHNVFKINDEELDEILKLLKKLDSKWGNYYLTSTIND